MPYLKIQTNTEIPAGKEEAVMKRLSGAVAEALGKPERYVMVALENTTPMLFGGTVAPCAYLELKSIGLPEELTPQLSLMLCETVAAELNIPGDRIYIEFANAVRHLWGWNGGTF
ncbi:MAG: phenylpyruvate tautomerase MIF-related protein [Gammaproteobacteria bacterium]